MFPRTRRSQNKNRGMLPFMTRPPVPRKRIVATLCALAFIEWVLFELVRTPYRPPDDMLTFLGQEKYAVMAIMVGILILSVALLWFWAVRSAWMVKDVIAFSTMLALLIGVGVFVVLYPGRPVTPLNLLLK